MALASWSVMFVLFVRETFPVEVTAIAGAALMLVLGILPIKDGLDGAVELGALDHRC